MKATRWGLGCRKTETMFLIILSAIILSSLAFAFILVQGHVTQFPPSEPRVAYAPEPNTRGTVSLIWSCVTTIFTCVYVSVHIDVPNPSRTADIGGDSSSGCVKTIMKWIRRPQTEHTFRRIMWMVFNIYVPELVVFIALYERMSAVAGQRFMSDVLGMEGWTMKHAFFADMGGFEVVEADNRVRVLRTGREFYEWILAHPNRVPVIEEIGEEIEDRSKSSGLLKTITCVQALWVLVETLARAIERQPISELEVATCGYILCALLIYLSWWSKPYDVGRRILLRHANRITPPTSPDEKTYYPRRGGEYLRVVEPGIGNREGRRFPDGALDRMPKLWEPDDPNPFTPFNRATNLPKKDALRAGYISGVVGALVGLLHCLLWNAQFINTTGQWMWRFSCIMQLTLPLIVAVAAAAMDRFPFSLFYAVILSTAFFYCVSRTLLIALLGLSFHSQPAGVYTEVNWPIPHWH